MLACWLRLVVCLWLVLVGPVGSFGLYVAVWFLVWVLLCMSNCLVSVVMRAFAFMWYALLAVGGWFWVHSLQRRVCYVLAADG